MYILNSQTVDSIFKYVLNEYLNRYFIEELINTWYGEEYWKNFDLNEVLEIIRDFFLNVLEEEWNYIIYDYDTDLEEFGEIIALTLFLYQSIKYIGDYIDLYELYLCIYNIYFYDYMNCRYLDEDSFYDLVSCTKFDEKIEYSIPYNRLFLSNFFEIVEDCIKNQFLENYEYYDCQSEYLTEYNFERIDAERYYWKQFVYTPIEKQKRTFPIIKKNDKFEPKYFIGKSEIDIIAYIIADCFDGELIGNIETSDEFDEFTSPIEDVNTSDESTFLDDDEILLIVSPHQPIRYDVYRLDFSNVNFDTVSRYSISDISQFTGLEESSLNRFLKTIKRKKQTIICGAPGTGKTYIAEKLARYLTNNIDARWELIQFHPAYTYEDFIQGIRPLAENGSITYKMVPGRFIEFCQKAESYQGICVLIIDEINRANLAQVFGELMYLLEYRDRKIRLAGSNELFGIPENVRIIGTMNTADRSIALVDHALRRRFAFIHLYPNYDVLRRYHQRETELNVDSLIKILENLNQAIDDPHYEMGISFFMTKDLKEDLADIWEMEIEPYLEEYFFDRCQKVEEFRWERIQSQIDLRSQSERSN